MEDRHSLKTSSAQSAEQDRVSSSPKTSLLTQHRNILRSCLTCHQREIRCDKRSPCSNCVRNDVLCCYPDVEQRQRRPQKATIGEISARLARLERTITAITKSTAAPDVEVAPDVAVPWRERGYPTTVGSPAELLVRDGDTSRYINEVILSRILGEARVTSTTL
jgi:Fungal Zn(2)-Cys(6) binuclear cluster domain